MRTVLLVLLALISGSCGTGPGEENYNFQSLNDIILTSTNHRHGYTQTQCFYCHVKQNIHQVDRLGSGELDAARALVDELGVASCSACHGNNGVGQ